MKANILILLLFSVVCGIAQDDARKTPAAIKPSTTDCPTWNQKSKKISKAAYFQSLRSNKTRVNQEAAANPTNNKSSKIQPNLVSQKDLNTNQKLYVTHSPEIRETKETTVLNPGKTEKSSGTIAPNTRSSDLTSEDKNVVTKQQKKTNSPVEKPISPEESEEAKSEIPPKKINEEDTKTEMKNAEKTDDKKNKRKLKRMAGKTPKVRKHSNAKCPSF